MYKTIVNPNYTAPVLPALGDIPASLKTPADIAAQIENNRYWAELEARAERRAKLPKWLSWIGNYI